MKWSIENLLKEAQKKFKPSWTIWNTHVHRIIKFWKLFFVIRVRLIKRWPFFNRWPHTLIPSTLKMRSQRALRIIPYFFFRIKNTVRFETKNSSHVTHTYKHARTRTQRKRKLFCTFVAPPAGVVGGTVRSTQCASHRRGSFLLSCACVLVGRRVIFEFDCLSRRCCGLNAFSRLEVASYYIFFFNVKEQLAVGNRSNRFLDDFFQHNPIAKYSFFSRVK